MRKWKFLLVLLVAGAAQATTTVVSDAASFVAAVNANNGKTSGGDVVILNSGTYNLSSSLHAGGDTNICVDIARPLTIQVAAGASVTMNCSSNYGFRILSSNVILDGFTIAAPYFAVQAVDALNLYGGTLTGMILRRLTVSTSAMGGQAISTGGVSDSIIELCTVTTTYNAGIVLDRGGPANAGSNRNLVVNNIVSGTTTGSGIAIKLSDYNTVAGNSMTNVAFNGVFVTGGQHNYIGQNFMDNGLTFTKETASGRQSLRNYAGNNLLALRGQPGSDTVWFDYDANYNFGFLNEGYNAGEAGMALFNSVGNVLRGNNFHNNPFGGIVVRKDPASGNTTPAFNSLQQNYLHDHPANGGITLQTEMQGDYGFNYISGDPGQISQPIGGIVASNSSNSSANSVFYSNIIRDLRQAESLNGTTNALVFLNRHLNTIDHYVLNGSSVQFDSGSAVLGGNYFSDFTTANGNPSNGATPYTNIRDQNNATGVNQDRYPFTSESLGKVYSIGLRIPSAGSYLAISSVKTIAWNSQGCMLVDLSLVNTAGSSVASIASNAADYGYYRWTVPNVTPGSYRLRADCKTSGGALTGNTSAGPAFQITPPDLLLLSPQSNLIQEANTPLQISWKKSAAIAAVDVYLRYSDSQAFFLVQGGVTSDYLTINTPVVNSNRVSVRLAYGGYGDSTDGWFTIRGTSSGSFTAPASADNLYVGTPSLVEWVSPQTTDYVTLDLIRGGTTKNIVTQLGDFSSYLMLVPDVQGAGATLRLTFYNSGGSVLQQISSASQNVQNSSLQPNAIAVSSGSPQSAAVNTSFGMPLQAVVTNASGTGIAGVAVTFASPGSGASGSFAGSTTVATNLSGIATAPAFTANGATGSYSVTATTGALSAAFALTNTAPVTGNQTNVGYFYNSQFVLDANGSGVYEGPPGDKFFFYVSQQAGDIAISGDWNGDGRTKVGIYRNGFWILDYNGNGVYDYDGSAAKDKFYALGGATSQGYMPVVGDWNGDGKSKIGYYQNGFWLLDYNGDGTYNAGDRFFALGGNANETPLLGDWNHDGRTKAGVFYSGNFALDYDGDGAFTAADKLYQFTTYAPSDKPVIGDWSGNGFSKVGVFKNGFWILDYNGNGTYDGVGAGQDKVYGFGGNSGEIPIVGDWSGDGRTKIGFYLRGFWALDFNGNGSFDGTNAGQDRFIALGGNTGEQPILGKW